jgi:uncharacterized protein YutE (UPF0331/DUF86 family)
VGKSNYVGSETKNKKLVIPGPNILTNTLPEFLSKKIKPFFDFTNSLIHRYWLISDEKLLSLVRENKNDFIAFIETIEDHIKRRQIA